MAGLRINTTVSVDKSVNSASYARINCRAFGPDSRINCRAFTHKLSRPLITYMYLYIKTCSWLHLSVENLAGFRTAGWPSNGESVLIPGQGGSPLFLK